MKRPKKVNYICVNAGCIGRKCNACVISELWQYIEHLESIKEAPQTSTNTGSVSFICKKCMSQGIKCTNYDKEEVCLCCGKPINSTRL